MDLAELHVHLEGSIEMATLLEIDPSLSPEEIDAATSYSDFAGFIASYVWVNRRLLTPEHYGIAARRLFNSLEAQDVVYAEVTLSAGVILWKRQDLAAVFDAVAGEAMRSRIAIRWILDATRQWGVEAARPILDFAAERQQHGIIALGIGGFEAQGPALWFRDLYAEARNRGLRLVAHAGETTDAQSIWDALEIGAERIGHGIRAVEDPRLMEHLREHQIPLEVCITSNVRTGAVPSLADHPVKKLYDAGVPIVLNTDDPALFGCSLKSEYELAASEFGLPFEELAKNAFRYAFAGHKSLE
jgi:adenosine deaminase/aminodeoxyfutalosine deaminase